MTKGPAVNNSNKARQAFLWITRILRSLGIPYIVTGGLAARAYGSRRPLNDIDIDIPENRLSDLADRVAKYIISGPTHFRDERWDLQLITLEYHGQLLDISGASQIKICDARTGIWKAMPDDFSQAEYRVLYNQKVPIIGRNQLVEYKSMLTGKHQKIDIQATLECKN